MSVKAAERSRLERRERAEHAINQAQRGRRLRVTLWIVFLTVLAAVVVAMLVTSRPESSDQVRKAPDFTLSDTNGDSVTLSDLRGTNVLLYFNEGAGCQSCIVQMGELEKHADDLADLNVKVFPIVMNTREQITADMTANGVETPFLLDDGTVSDAYGTLGKGMHAGLPGHSFVLIDETGTQRWYGEYPSMWLAPTDLLKEVRARL